MRESKISMIATKSAAPIDSEVCSISTAISACNEQHYI